MDQVPQYEDYVNMIRKEAWRRVKKYPSLDFEELVSQGGVAFAMCLKSWNPSKGKFSTHLWWWIQDQMSRVKGCIPCLEEEKNTVLIEDAYQRSGHTYHHNQDGMSQERQPFSLDDLELGIQISDDAPGPFEETKFRSGLTSLSKEALEVVYLILDCPQELIDWTIRWIRPSQSLIRTFLHSLGWKPKKIEKVFGEIKSMLNEM